MSRQTRPFVVKDANYTPIQDSSSWTTKRLAYTGDNIEYVGIARIGASESDPVWQISKLAYDANDNLISVKWPTASDGAISNEFNFVWDNRAGYTYS